jgi:surfeit locus 1 family protein
MTLLTLLACAAFVSLGLWQWRKGQLRQDEWDRFERGAAQVQPLDSLGLSEVSRFQRVSLTGRLDGEHQLLLDNRTHEGRAGYEVLTPLARPDGRIVLVDRGWVPFTGQRSRLPAVQLPSRGLVTVTGRTDDLPASGLQSGRSAPAAGGTWPKVTSYPTWAELREVLGEKLEPRLVLLDADQPDGYVRQWQPPGMPPLRHLSYAIQWWAFAALALILWGRMSFRPMEKR